jgi:hypothetical protein
VPETPTCSDPVAYQLRVVLRGVCPLIWRRPLVRSDSTVADLHAMLQLCSGWTDTRCGVMAQTSRGSHPRAERYSCIGVGWLMEDTLKGPFASPDSSLGVPILMTTTLCSRLGCTPNRRPPRGCKSTRRTPDLRPKPPAGHRSVPGQRMGTWEGAMPTHAGASMCRARLFPSFLGIPA